MTDTPAIPAIPDAKIPPSAEARGIAADFLGRGEGARNRDNLAVAIDAFAAQARTAALAECEQIAERYADSPPSQDSNNTQEAFDLGMNHEAGCVDCAGMILDAIRALSRPTEDGGGR